jgi:hypothetical protein
MSTQPGVRRLAESELLPKTRRIRLPRWVTELALILAWPLAIAVSWTLGDVFGSWVWIAFWLIGLLGWGFFCLGGFARSDPVGFASIMAPPIALAGVALAVLAVGGRAGTIILASLAWELVWTLACSRIWPWWSRNVLRRVSARIAGGRAVERMGSDHATLAFGNDNRGRQSRLGSTA